MNQAAKWFLITVALAFMFGALIQYSAVQQMRWWSIGLLLSNMIALVLAAITTLVTLLTAVTHDVISPHPHEDHP